LTRRASRERGRLQSSHPRHELNATADVVYMPHTITENGSPGPGGPEPIRLNSSIQYHEGVTDDEALREVWDGALTNGSNARRQSKTLPASPTQTIKEEETPVWNGVVDGAHHVARLFRMTPSSGVM